MSDASTGTDDAVVRYGVKELLALQGETLKRIESKVDASTIAQAEVNAKIDTRVSLLEALNVGPRLAELEEARSEGTGRRSLGTFALPVLLTVIWIALGIISLVHHP